MGAWTLPAATIDTTGGTTVLVNTPEDRFVGNGTLQVSSTVWLDEDSSRTATEFAMTGGLITIDGGAHWLRPLRMWLGEIDEVIAVTERPLAAMEGESLTRALEQQGAAREQVRQIEEQMTARMEQFNAQVERAMQ